MPRRTPPAPAMGGVPVGPLWRGVAAAAAAGAGGGAALLCAQRCSAAPCRQLRRLFRPSRPRREPQAGLGGGASRICATQQTPEIEALHSAACSRGEETYTDPKTGFMVFTELAHSRRGHCCGSACRHCPYGHENVGRPKAQQIRRPTTSDRAAAAAAAPAPATSSLAADSGLAATKTVYKKASVYTRTGDKGTSALFSGERRPKDDLVFEAMGAVDELNAHIGLAREWCRTAENGIDVELEWVQKRLLDAGSHIATPRTTDSEYKLALTEFTDSHTLEVEQWIDRVTAQLPPLTCFVLPTGGLAASQLHVARTVCRRAERALVRLAAAQEMSTGLLRWVNRLSDLLFTLARQAARHEGRSDIHRPGRAARQEGDRVLVQSQPASFCEP